MGRQIKIKKETIMLKIITDSSANITPNEAEKIGIELLPLTVIFGDKEYRDGVDLDAASFYKMLASENDYPHTSQVNTDTFEEIFLTAKANGDTLLVILISSVLSGTYSAAVRAKENIGYANVHIYDSKATTVKQRLLVQEAVRLRDRSVEEVIKHLDDVRSRCELYAIVDTLEYLHKGGRLKKSAAMLGTLFNIKPVVTITASGAVEVAGKSVGTRSAIKSVAKIAGKSELDPDFPVFYIYTAVTDKCEKLIDAITPGDAAYLKNAVNICPVIGAHVGPGAAGVCFVRKA